MGLLKRIEAYLKRSGTTTSAFGRAALGDPSLVRDMRRGRELRPRTQVRLLAFLDALEGAE